MTDYEIVDRPYICEIDYDGIVFECYGTSYIGDEPDVEQVALKGSDVCLNDVLGKNVFDSLCNSVELKYLVGKLDDSPDTRYEE